MDLGIAGKCALVTGASMGIGRASAVALAKEGVKLAVAARRRNLLEDLQEETGPLVIIEQDFLADGAAQRIADAALTDRQRADPAQLQSRAARERGTRGHSGGRIRQTRGRRESRLLPRLAACAIHHRYRDSGRRRDAPLPVLEDMKRLALVLLM